jgi:hypothetical protein
MQLNEEKHDKPATPEPSRRRKIVSVVRKLLEDPQVSALHDMANQYRQCRIGFEICTAKLREK